MSHDRNDQPADQATPAVDWPVMEQSGEVELPESEEASPSQILLTEITIASVRMGEIYGLPSRYRNNLSAVMRRRGRLLPPKPRRAGWRLAKAARKLEGGASGPVVEETALFRDLKTLNSALDRLGTRDRLMGKPLTIAASFALLALISAAAWVATSYGDNLRELGDAFGIRQTDQN